jgi:hypothetical protein
MTGINQRADRNLDKYIALGNVFLLSPVPKIVFLDSAVFDLVLSQHASLGGGSIQMKDGTSLYYRLLADGNTVVVEYDKRDMYFYSYADRLDQFAVSSANPDKDTVEYMFVQCHKTEWVRLAILLVEQLSHVQIVLTDSGDGDVPLFELLRACPRNNQYVWMDYGIAHMWSGDSLAFYDDMRATSSRVQSRFLGALAAGNPMNTVYCASCWNDVSPELDLYREIAWRFAGTVFGGFDDALIQFADLMRKKCTEIMLERRTLMWEVNVWTLVWREHGDLFGFYHCDHTPAMLRNY